MGVLKESTQKNTILLYFFVAVTTLRLELPNIAEVAVYLATQYVQTTTNIVIYGSASLQEHFTATCWKTHVTRDTSRTLEECIG